MFMQDAHQNVFIYISTILLLQILVFALGMFGD